VSLRQLLLIPDALTRYRSFSKPATEMSGKEVVQLMKRYDLIGIAQLLIAKIAYSELSRLMTW